MTAYNTARFLPEAINSVLKQQHTHWELLIADDASADESRSIIDAYALKDSRIKVSHNAQNMHYLRTRNRLIKLAKGDFITFLDSDDLMTSDRLFKQLNFLQRHPKIALCGSYVSYIDATGKELSVERPDPPIHHEAMIQALPNYNPVTGSTIFIRSGILREFGSYRDFFHGLCSEDYDLVSRIAEKYQIANVPERLYVYRQFEASTSRAGRQNPMKRFSGEIVQALIKERLAGKPDALEREDQEAIVQWVQELQAPYKQDPSKIHIDLVSSHLYAGLKGKAVQSAWHAIRANPRKIYNFRTFWYTIKKLLG